MVLNGRELGSVQNSNREHLRSRSRARKRTSQVWDAGIRICGRHVWGGSICGARRTSTAVVGFGCTSCCRLRPVCYAFQCRPNVHMSSWYEHTRTHTTNAHPRVRSLTHSLSHTHTYAQHIVYYIIYIYEFYAFCDYLICETIRCTYKINIRFMIELMLTLHTHLNTLMYSHHIYTHAHTRTCSLAHTCIWCLLFGFFQDLHKRNSPAG